MRHTDVFFIPVFSAMSRLLYIGTGTPLFDSFLNLFICETTLEVRTSDSRGPLLRGSSCKLPVPLKCRIRDISPAEVIGTDLFCNFFSVRNLH